jgi:hypothetical protein
LSQYPFCQRLELTVTDLLAVNDEPFVETGQVGRGEETGPDTATFQDGAEKGGGGPLAVGSDDVDRPEPALRIAQDIEKPRDPLVARLGTETGPAEYLGQELLEGHGWREL